MDTSSLLNCHTKSQLLTGPVRTWKFRGNVKCPPCFSLSLLRAKLLGQATKREEFLLLSDTAHQWGPYFHKVVRSNCDCIKRHILQLFWLHCCLHFRLSNLHETVQLYDLIKNGPWKLWFRRRSIWAHTHRPPGSAPLCSQEGSGTKLMTWWQPSSFPCAFAGAQRNGLRNRRSKILQWTFKLK